MEKWDLYTKYREKTGKEHIRGEKIPDEFYHLVVHVWIRNNKGEYLISKRAADRPTHPLMWETPGGSVIKGENSLEGAIREVKEETGLDLCKENGKLLFTRIRTEKNDIMDVWLFEYNGISFDGIQSLKNATTAEVEACHFASKEEIKKLYNSGKFVDTLDYFFYAFKELFAESTYKPDYSGIIGKTVQGKIDRPVFSFHPEYKDIIYPLNYGYIEDVPANNGELQDAYIFGTDKPLDNFQGKVIAVFRRFNDMKDKWIVSLDGNDIPDEKILGCISFQEQYFYGKLYR